MSQKHDASLSREQPPWLFAAAIAATAPHALALPPWLTAFAVVLFAWAGWLWWEDRRLPGRWVLLVLTVAGNLAILAEYRTLFGREPGVALLVMFMALKLLEMRHRRDAVVVVMLAYFLLLTHYLHSQEIIVVLWLIVALWLVTAALTRLHAGPIERRDNLRLAGTLLLQSLPLMLVLYLLFPRISGPLWGLPADANTGRTGLSERMNPGSIAELVSSGEVAFRVRFDGAPPARRLLYWRGPVLEDFDGTSWQRSPRRLPAEVVQADGPEIAYETTLEAHGQRWLLALDAPLTLPEGASRDGRLAVLAAQAIDSRQRFRLRAATAFRFNPQEAPATLADNLRLPTAGNPRARALAREWQQQARAPAELVDLALRHFNREAFHYTLRPPLLGRDSIDDFLFRSRRGFCEHYASSFVFLMRAAGLPARVVSGYQGGEFNPLDGYLVVRQSEAHAWAEVWFAGRGWTRVDPTAAVAPERIEQGIASALPAGEPLPAFLLERADWLRDLRHRWEAVNNAWNQYILGYDGERQRQFLSQLGFANVDWRLLATLLGIAGSGVLAAILLLNLWHRPRVDEARRLWRRAQRRIGLNCAPQETPLAFAERVRRTDPALAPAVDAVVRHYLLARYARTDPEHLAALRAAVNRLPRRRFV